MIAFWDSLSFWAQAAVVGVIVALVVVLASYILAVCFDPFDSDLE